MLKRCIAYTALAAGAAAIVTFATGAARAVETLRPEVYNVSVQEFVVGQDTEHASNVIEDYSTQVNAPLSALSPQFQDFSFEAASGTNSAPGDYRVLGEADNQHGGTVRALAFGDGAFAGLSKTQYSDVAEPAEGYAYSVAQLQYGFMLIGPSSQTTIPVLMNASAYTKTTGTGSASLTFSISGANGDLFDWELSDDESAQTGTNYYIPLLPNVQYIVDMEAFAFSSPQSGFDGSFDSSRDSGSGDAFVDPTFALTGADAALYHFEGLPPGAQITGAPELPTWALMLTGMCGISLLARRRLRQETIQRSLTSSLSMSGSRRYC